MRPDPRPTGLGLLLLCAGTFLAAGMLYPRAAALAADTSIAGLVRNGTTGRPVPGEMVTLVFIGPQGPEGGDQTRTGADGRFAFHGLSDGRYLVQVVHQGVSYAEHALINGASANVTVQIFDVSDRVQLRVILLGMMVDVQPGYVRISEVVHLQNPASQTFLGPVTFPLPPGARYITFGDGLHEPQVQGTQILDRLIIRPGAYQVAYGYSVPGSDEIPLDRRLTLPVERIEVFTVAPAEARSPRLQQLPAVTNEGQTYTRASGRAMPQGDLAMSIVGVPAVQMWLAPAAAGTLAGLLIVGLMWAVAREEREAGGGVAPGAQNR